MDGRTLRDIRHLWNDKVIIGTWDDRHKRTVNTVYTVDTQLYTVTSYSITERKRWRS